MAAKGFRAQLLRMLGRAVDEMTKPKPVPARTGRPASDPSTSSRSTSGRSTPRPSAPAGRENGPGEAERSAYAGDFTGVVKLEYTPVDDGRPDPGEVVWAWVPFEEDHSQGKDRPVLIIGRSRELLLGLMLTSKDHDRDHDQEARHGRYWLDLGAGAWDREGRPSEARLDRILQLEPAAVRREGAVLDRSAFDRVAVGVRRAKRW